MTETVQVLHPKVPRRTIGTYAISAEAAWRVGPFGVAQIASQVLRFGHTHAKLQVQQQQRQRMS